MDFSGTKGKWVLRTFREGQMSVRNESDTRKICVPRVQNYEESLANLLLISKAPEMLEMLISLKDRLLHFNDTLSVNEVDKLIKEATKFSY